MKSTKVDSAHRRLRAIDNQLATQRPWLAELTRRGKRNAVFVRARDRVAALEAEREEIMQTWFSDGLTRGV